jgi:hypothetical protein
MSPEKLIEGLNFILAKKEEAYQLLSVKPDISELKNIDEFLAEYVVKIDAYRKRVKEYNYDYTFFLIVEDFKNGKYLTDEQIEKLFWLIEGDSLQWKSVEEEGAI